MHWKGRGVVNFREKSNILANFLQNWNYSPTSRRFDVEIRTVHFASGQQLGFDGFQFGSAFLFLQKSSSTFENE